MPQTYYDSELTGQQIEDALEAIDGVIAPANNGKVLCIVDGKIGAKSASEWGAGAVLEPLSVTANDDYTPSAGVDGFDSVHVAVPNSYAAADEGKVVSNGALVAQTSRNLTQNGTYDTTENSEVVVNVSGGGGSVTVFKDASTWLIMQKFNSSVLRSIVSQELDRSNYSPSFTYNSLLSFGDILTLLDAELFFGYELYGNIDSDIIAGFDLELLGDFSTGGSASGNSLTGAITNYRAVILNGIYNTQKGSTYNTSVFYLNPQLNTPYWAGMKDRNTSYDCFVTFTDAQTVSLSGNRQVVIYGLP